MEHHGREARKLLAALYVSRNVPAHQLAMICHHVTLSQGRGVADIGKAPGVHIGRYSEHVKLALGKEYGFADLDYVDAPMTDIKNGARTLASIPILQPSRWFANGGA